MIEFFLQKEGNEGLKAFPLKAFPLHIEA